MTDSIITSPWKEFTAKKGFKVTLNLRLAKQQGINEETLQKIADMHEVKHWAIESMKLLSPDDKINLRIASGEITHYEFVLQDLWNFPRNINFHRFWELPHCTCPKMDNEERWGTPYSVMNCSCPIHGDR